MIQGENLLFIGLRRLINKDTRIIILRPSKEQISFRKKQIKNEDCTAF